MRGNHKNAPSVFLGNSVVSASTTIKQTPCIAGTWSSLSSLWVRSYLGPSCLVSLPNQNLCPDGVNAPRDMETAMKHFKTFTLIPRKTYARHSFTADAEETKITLQLSSTAFMNVKVLITPWKDLAGDMKWRRDPDPECKPRWRKGRCRHKLTRYYYDVKNKRCRPFTYSGCGGNYNNYATYEQCAQKCEPFGSPDYSKHPERNPETKPHTCNLPVDVGPCNASFPRFYYDAKTKSCKPFNFGGCNGNSNNFGTIEDCILECKNRG
ncbi:tissue factor pathway inhibitor isoform X2 [Anolis carolinensis]|uniref:tissue factor pathway inhibitor isoform X2 n=1 Tax=Anolis carolinensis TaxID=28377 RepID=UPI002F2B1964